MSAEPVVPAALAAADDEVLMARFVAGEVEAFEALYERHEASVFGFCLRLLGDGDAAEDAFQETMVSVIAGAPEYLDRGRFRGWLYTLARNACLDRARRDGRRRDLLAAAPTRPGPVGLETSVELRDELSRVLATLSGAQREVLLLHRYEGFSYAEIARMTGSTEAAVKQRAYRALRTLRGYQRSSTRAEGGT